MVKRADVLDKHERDEADGPYEAQPLARRAPRARKTATLVLALWTALFVAYALDARGWLVAAAFAAACAGLVWRGRLAGIVGAGLLALLGIGIPLAMWAVKMRPFPADFVAVVLGLALLPSLITLTRDAELQHAYGLWARR